VEDPEGEFRRWLEAIGAVVVTMPPAEHDRVVARTSHLPQLLSTALALTLAGELESADQLRVAGPGLSDTIRLAGSSYEVWGDILSTNSEPIDGALARFIAQLEQLRANLGSVGMELAFAAANEFAARLRRARGR
jgi:prephenate dehydrogenase